jgi:hypothetical protein
MATTLDQTATDSGAVRAAVKNAKNNEAYTDTSRHDITIRLDSFVLGANTTILAPVAWFAETF